MLTVCGILCLSLKADGRLMATLRAGNDHAVGQDDGSCDKYISAIVRMQSNSQTLPPMEYFDPLQDVYITEHSAEGLIRRSDHRYEHSSLNLNLIGG